MQTYKYGNRITAVSTMNLLEAYNTFGKELLSKVNEGFGQKAKERSSSQKEKAITEISKGVFLVFENGEEWNITDMSRDEVEDNLDRTKDLFSKLYDGEKDLWKHVLGVVVRNEGISLGICTKEIKDITPRTIYGSPNDLDSSKRVNGDWHEYAKQGSGLTLQKKTDKELGSASLTTLQAAFRKAEKMSGEFGGRFTFFVPSIDDWLFIENHIGRQAERLVRAFNYSIYNGNCMTCNIVNPNASFIYRGLEDSAKGAKFDLRETSDNFNQSPAFIPFFTYNNVVKESFSQKIKASSLDPSSIDTAISRFAVFNSAKLNEWFNEYYNGSFTLDDIKRDIDKICDHPESPFKTCEEFDEDALLKSLGFVPGRMFRSNPNLKSISIPYGVTLIQQSAFENCKSLESVKIPESVNDIRSDAFSHCTSLKEVNLPNSLKEVGRMVFSNCESLESIIIPDSVTSISGYTFRGCVNLKKIKMSKNLKILGTSAFQRCPKLRSVTLPDTLEEINDEAFYGCLSLRSMVIPPNVRYIGESTFRGCKKLETVYIKGKTSTSNFAFVDCSPKLTVYVMDERYKTFSSNMSFDAKIGRQGKMVVKKLSDLEMNEGFASKVKDDARDIEQSKIDAADQMMQMSMSNAKTRLLEQSSDWNFIEDMDWRSAAGDMTVIEGRSAKLSIDKGVFFTFVVWGAKADSPREDDPNQPDFIGTNKLVISVALEESTIAGDDNRWFEASLVFRNNLNARSFPLNIGIPGDIEMCDEVIGPWQGCKRWHSISRGRIDALATTIRKIKDAILEIDKRFTEVFQQKGWHRCKVFDDFARVSGDHHGKAIRHEYIDILKDVLGDDIVSESLIEGFSQKVKKEYNREDALNDSYKIVINCIDSEKEYQKRIAIDSNWQECDKRAEFLHALKKKGKFVEYPYIPSFLHEIVKVGTDGLGVRVGIDGSDTGGIFRRIEDFNRCVAILKGTKKAPLYIYTSQGDEKQSGTSPSCKFAYSKGAFDPARKKSERFIRGRFTDDKIHFDFIAVYNENGGTHFMHENDVFIYDREECKFE